MNGLIFVRADHFGNMYLPHADYPAEIYLRASQLVAREPHLSPWLPDLRKLDFYLETDGAEFLLAIAGEQKLHAPTYEFRESWLEGFKERSRMSICPHGKEVVDYSSTELAAEIFRELGRKVGPVVGGRYTVACDDASNALKERVWDGGAAILVEWARRTKEMIERNRLFLSHKGVDKPLVRAVAETLNLIGVKTWLDEKQLPAGRPLVRSLGEGVSDCCAGVFFISASFNDATYIRQEIDWALQTSADDPDFRIIPVVLSDHGGTAQMVPDALRYLSWKEVRDAEIVKAVVAALPKRLTDTIRFVGPD